MKVALVCGEPSGDLLGAGLAQALLKLSPQTELVGVTGVRMRAAGVRSWLDCGVFSVMGYWDALRKIWPLWSARSKVLRELRQEPPAVFVGIDAPDLNMDLGIAVHNLGGKYVQYVCPSFWVWRAERAKVLAKHCDRVLALLPFELEHCAAAGIPARLVGHRLADELVANSDARAMSRQKLGIAAGDQVLALLPGSRPQELVVHEPLFAEAARRCKRQRARLKIYCAPVAGVALSGGTSSDISYCPGQARALLAAADAAIVKSGTITLEAALLGCPQVIAYRTSPLAAWFIRRKMSADVSRNYGLPNLILGRRAVPELIQEQATPEALAAAILTLLDSQHGIKMKDDYQEIRGQLAMDADLRAAQAVLDIMTP